MFREPKYDKNKLHMDIGERTKDLVNIFVAPKYMFGHILSNSFH